MIFHYFLTFITGILAGLLGGLLGIGGGIVVMPYLKFIVGLPTMFAAGTTVIAVFFTTFGGSVKHYRLGHIDFKVIAPVIISGAVMSLLFSLVFPHLKLYSRWLDFAIGILFLFIASRMIFESIWFLDGKKSHSNNGSAVKFKLWHKITIGSVAGALPGLLGIGSGAILVAVFTFLFDMPIKIAIGSSLACFSINAFISSVMKASQGFVDWNIAIPLSIGAFIGANIGAKLNKIFSSKILHLIFGLLFLYISAKFILLFYGVKI